MKRLLCALAATMSLFFSQGESKPAPGLPEIGKPVPAFRLNDHLGSAISIAPDPKATEGNWTVLAFFPKAATPG